MLAHLFFINPLDQSHSKGHLLLFPSDDNLRLVHTWRGNIDAGAGLLHHLAYNFTEGTGEEWVVHLVNVHPLNSTLILKR